MDGGIRVLLAAGDAAADGIAAELQQTGFEVCAMVNDAEEAVDWARRERPELCIIDVGLPGGGLHAVEAITREVADTAVIVLADSDEAEGLFAALRAGAAGYLDRDIDPQRLSVTLAGVLDGQAAISRTLVTRVVEEFRGTGARRIRVGDRTVDLTAREREVLHRLERGLTSREIGEELFISPVTARRHISTLLHKLRVADRDEAVRLLRDQHVV